MKMVDDVYKIGRNGNMYLIMKPVPTIIDSGDAVDREYIKSEVEKIIPLDEIKVVLLTHLHNDHIGNVVLFPNAKIYADDAEIEDYKNEPENFFFGSVPSELHNFLLGKLNPLPEKISGFDVIRVPGHTRGSVVFLDKKRKLLFSGDTLFEKGVGRTDFKNRSEERRVGKECRSRWSPEH